MPRLPLNCFPFWCLFHWLIPCSAAIASPSDYIGQYDREYVRVKTVANGTYLYATPYSTGILSSTDQRIHDLGSHWYVEKTGTVSFGIINRITGHSMELAEGTYDIEQLPQGAVMPWSSYDEDNFVELTAPAHVDRTTYDSGFSNASPAAESQKNACIVLNDFGTRVTWMVTESANTLTLRYSLIDKTEGTITLTITPNGSGSAEVIKIPVNTDQAWVYFQNGQEYDNDTIPSSRIPAKRFAEARLRLDTPVNEGDLITFSREAGDELIWIDVVELEYSEEFLPASMADYYIATSFPWNARGDGITDDRPAIAACLSDAAADGKKVFLPTGTYRLGSELVLPENSVLQGAGMWYTELLFSNSGYQGAGGIRGNGSNLILKDLYLKGSQTTRDGGYKGIKGFWGTGSLIENVWVEETETGAWIADFTPPIGVTDGLIFRNCRFRNTFADGINLSSGTINSVVENCHFRGNGDDALATWAAGRDKEVGPTLNQKFRYNTIECGYRAGGIGIFGGGSHKIHHNVVRDQYVGAGIRLNTNFIWVNGAQIGYPFQQAGEPIRIYSNRLIRTGARGLFNSEIAAIDLQTKYGNVENIHFSDMTVQQSQFSGIRFAGNYTNDSPLPVFKNIRFENIEIHEVPVGTVSSGIARGGVEYKHVSHTSVQQVYDIDDNFYIDDNVTNDPPDIRLITPSRIVIPSPSEIPLQGTITDDGFPKGAGVTATWSVTRKPVGSSVILGDPHSINTQVLFDTDGEYHLQLDADDSEFVSSATVRVRVGEYLTAFSLFEGQDIGVQEAPGSTSSNNETYSVRGGGADIWEQADAFHFFATPFVGDAVITVRILSQDGTHEWAKAGLMIRDSLEPGSPHSLIALTPSNGLAFQERRVNNSITYHDDAGSYSLPLWLRLVRSGSSITAYQSSNGQEWTDVGGSSFSMDGANYMGLAVSSHDTDVLSEATFDQLQVEFAYAKSAWTSLHFGTAPNPLSPMDADPNQNGWSNLYEYANGTDPNAIGYTSAIRFPIVDLLDRDNQGSLAFTFLRRKGNGSGSIEDGYSVDDITYLPEAASRLIQADWKSGSSVFAPVQILDNGNGTETVTVRYLGPLDPQAFMRLRITED